MLDDATMVAGSRAIVDRVEQGSVAVGYGVTRRRRDPADPAGTSSQPPNLISLRKSLFFFEREEDGGMETGIEPGSSVQDAGRVRDRTLRRRGV